MQKQIDQFFKENPEATEVHHALGVVFVGYEEAAAFLGGIIGHQVVTAQKPTAIADDASELQKESSADNASEIKKELPADKIPESVIPAASTKK